MFAAACGALIAAVVAGCGSSSSDSSASGSGGVLTRYSAQHEEMSAALAKGFEGKLAIAPSEPDFVPVVRAIEILDGKAAAKTWLEGFAANAKHYNDNEGIIAAVDAGQVGAGIINHYYWYEAIAEEGASQVPSKLHYFGNEDPGALIDISGAAALSSSHDPELAQEFLAYVTSDEGQEAMTHSGDWEYPLNSAATPPPGLVPFAKLDPPPVTPADLGDGSGPVHLMQEVGLL